MAAEDRDLNRDPITDEPGSHPVGTGVGATGGAVAGAAAGAIGWPVGMAVGGVVGAVDDSTNRAAPFAALPLHGRWRPRGSQSETALRGSMRRYCRRRVGRASHLYDLMPRCAE